jgi:hypothetical protein
MLSARGRRQVREATLSRSVFCCWLSSQECQSWLRALLRLMTMCVSCVIDIVACTPVDRQQPRNKQIYNSRCYVTAPQTSIFPRQRQNTAIMQDMFSTRSVPRCFTKDQLAVAVRKLLGFSCGELLLLEAGIWGREHFGNPQEGERPPLEAASKRRQWRRDCW